MLTPGSSLGRYEVLGPLGAGGMGEVYRARDPRLGREVAIKVLPSSFAADAERLRRFEQEARAAGALNHPNVLSIHDVDTHDGAPYLVSELLNGETLRARLGGAALSTRRAIDFARQIAQGLAAAHEKGIAHRDLKPDNVFVTDDGQVKILDFGLAKLTRPELGLDLDSPTRTAGTDAGTVLGTAGYMSPEQVRGKTSDHRSDVFAFGAILYEMLAGRRAFQGETTADTMTAILKEDPPDLSTLNAGIPPGLERVVRHCLEKNAAERFQSARDLAFDLDALSGDTSSSGHVAAIRAPSRRRAALALLGLGLLGLYTTGAFLTGRRSARTSPPAFRQLTFRNGTVTSARFAPDGSTVLYTAAWEGEPSELFSTRLDSPLSQSLGLREVVVAATAAGEMAVLRADPANPSSGVTLARVPLTGGIPRVVVEGIQGADWTSDGRSFVVHRWTGGREQIEFPMGKVLYETAGSIAFPRISPAADRIAFFDAPIASDNRGSIAVVDLAGSKRTLSGPWNDVTGLAWSPDGREIWFTASQGAFARDLRAVDLSGRERQLLALTGRLTLHDIARDGRVVLEQARYRGEAYGRGHGETGERSLTWLDLTALAGLSGDGTRVMFTEWGEGGGPNYSIYVRGMDGSAPVRLGDGWGVDLSPDGQWVVAIKGLSPTHLELVPTGAGEPRPLARGTVFQHNSPRFFPDSRRLVFFGNEAGRPVRLFLQDIPDGTPKPITAEGTETAGVLSPDGRWVVAYPSSQGNTAALYPVDGGEPRPIPGIAASDAVVAWAADGHSLFVAESLARLPVRVFRLDLATGRRELWREIAPANRSGVAGINRVLMTPDGRAYAYGVRRILSDLYLVSDVK